MQHYRWINYPAHISPELKAKYEALADLIEAAATQPIALVWATDHEDWQDDNGINPDRDRLLITKLHDTGEPGEGTFGLTLSTHKLHN